MSTKEKLVDELVYLLEKGNAHLSFEEAIAGVPVSLAGIRPEGMPYSIWQLVEHIRIAQWDIVSFCLSEQHRSLDWPEGYWPPAAGPVSESQWNHSIREIRQDRERFIKLLRDRSDSLFDALPWGDGQTLLREALVIADHNAYHTGEIVVLRRLLGCWK